MEDLEGIWVQCQWCGEVHQIQKLGDSYWMECPLCPPGMIYGGKMPYRIVEGR